MFCSGCSASALQSHRIEYHLPASPVEFQPFSKKVQGVCSHSCESCHLKSIMIILFLQRNTAAAAPHINFLCWFLPVKLIFRPMVAMASCQYVITLMWRHGNHDHPHDQHENESRSPEPAVCVAPWNHLNRWNLNGYSRDWCFGRSKIFPLPISCCSIVGWWRWCLIGRRVGAIDSLYLHQGCQPQMYLF